MTPKLPIICKMAPKLPAICKMAPKVSKGHFSNLTSKNDVVMYFPSNLTVLTNIVAKMQLFGSL
jgi:hypothetical protein